MPFYVYPPIGTALLAFALKHAIYGPLGTALLFLEIFSFVFSPGGFAVSISFSAFAVAGVPSNSMMTSASRTPAASAGEPAVTPDTTIFPLRSWVFRPMLEPDQPLLCGVPSYVELI